MISRTDLTRIDFDTISKSEFLV